LRWADAVSVQLLVWQLPASRKQTTAAQRLQRQGDSERQFLEVCGLIATLSHPRGLVTTPRDMGMTADIRAVP